MLLETVVVILHTCKLGRLCGNCKEPVTNCLDGVLRATRREKGDTSAITPPSVEGMYVAVASHIVPSVNSFLLSNAWAQCMMIK